MLLVLCTPLCFYIPFFDGLALKYGSSTRARCIWILGLSDVGCAFELLQDSILGGQSLNAVNAV